MGGIIANKSDIKYKFIGDVPPGQAIPFQEVFNEKIKENRKLLQQLIQKKGLKITGESTFLGYNAPYQFWSRKNEIIIPIEWKE